MGQLSQSRFVYSCQTNTTSAINVVTVASTVAPSLIIAEAPEALTILPECAAGYIAPRVATAARGTAAHAMMRARGTMCCELHTAVHLTRHISHCAS